MNDLEVLLQIAHDKGLKVAWMPFSRVTKGLIRGNLVVLRQGLTSAEAADVLAEELAHDLLTVGDITDQSDTNSRKQETQARRLAYDIRIGLRGIISCFRAGCHNSFEMAEHLNVSEEFLKEALSYYQCKYGVYVEYENYLIYFTPKLAVFQRR